MKTLRLEDNALNGTLPSSWSTMSRLKRLHLNDNSLSGTLPPEWSAFTLMKSLHLSSNDLSGTLPSAWQSMTFLIHLKLRSNSFTGTVPSVWSSMTILQNLSLRSNYLNGSLPASWSSMTKLAELSIRSNDLTGSLPTSWSAMIAMEDLHMRSNGFTGSLPAAWASMLKLQWLNLRSNNLTGPLPSSWAVMTTLETLDLQNNNFIGSLPSSWGAMTNLQELHLNNNQLNSTLPVAWGQMESMEDLDLSANQLTGLLPSSWGNMTKLVALLLDENCLEGFVPGSYSSLALANVSLCQTRVHRRMINCSDDHQWPSYCESFISSSPSFAASESMSISASSLASESQSRSNTISDPASRSTSAKTSATLLRHDAPSNSTTPTMDTTRTISSSILTPTVSRSTLLSLGSLTPSQSAMLSGSSSHLSSTAATTKSATSITPKLSAALMQGEATDSLSRTISFTVSVPTSSSSFSFSSPSSYTPSTSSFRRRSLSSLVSNSAHPPQTLSLVDRANLSRSFSLSTRMCGGVFSYTTFVGLTNVVLTSNATTYFVEQPPVVVLQLPNDSQRVAVMAATANVVTLPVTRSVLSNRPALLVNISLESKLSGHQLQWLNITNVTRISASHQPCVFRISNQTFVASSEGFTFAVVVVIQPPENGWLAPGTSYFVDSSIMLVASLACDESVVLELAINIPCLAVPLASIASKVEAATKYSLIAAALTGGASSGSALGRVMATRSMVLCNADAAVGGGAVELHFEICGDDDPSSLVARSAILSNVLLLVAAAGTLFVCAAAWCFLCHTTFYEALLVVCLPSSVLPAWTVTLTSTSGAATLLWARIGASPCPIVDSLIGVVGVVFALCTTVVVILTWLDKVQLATDAPGFWRCIPVVHVARDADEQRNLSGWHPNLHLVTRVALHKRWRWTTTDHHSTEQPLKMSGGRRDDSLRAAAVLVSEFRVLWYAALDQGLLVLFACLSVVSGLNQVDDTLCRAATIITVALLLTQLIVLGIAHPFTTLFSFVHGLLTLTLTTVSVLAQFLYALLASSTTQDLWLIELTAGCNLAIVGVSAAKMLVDLIELGSAAKRRLLSASSLRSARRIIRQETHDEDVEVKTMLLRSHDDFSLEEESMGLMPLAEGQSNDNTLSVNFDSNVPHYFEMADSSSDNSNINFAPTDSLESSHVVRTEAEYSRLGADLSMAVDTYFLLAGPSDEN
ncbi:GP46-like surface antigen, putative [Bodo saltans]|nr:GP46-like surface antigen, putative [Bodo saltans]|eukprot:CUG76321.1 GP46-like surface antigen, putative [Bodo saltans]